MFYLHLYTNIDFYSLFYTLQENIVRPTLEPQKIVQDVSYKTAEKFIK